MSETITAITDFAAVAGVPAAITIYVLYMHFVSGSRGKSDPFEALRDKADETHEKIDDLSREVFQLRVIINERLK